MSGEPEIYCPKCAFRPGAQDRWMCMPGCGTQWNTFWTRGVCPGCGHAWQDTQCLACLEMSPHEAWYHYPDDIELNDAEAEDDIAAPANAEAIAYFAKALPKLESLAIETTDPIGYAEFLDTYVAALKASADMELAQALELKASELRAKHPGQRAHFKPVAYPADCKS